MEIFDLKSFRQDKNISQKELADLFGCNQNFISRIESGIRPLPVEKLEKLKTKFGDISKWLTDISSNNTRVTQKNEKGDNLNDAVKVVTDNSDFFAIISKKDEQIAKKDEQIDRLLSIIERMQGQA